MYIQLTHSPSAPVLISRKLFKAMGFKGPAPWFIILTRIRGTDTFALVPAERADTFRTQCCMVLPVKGNRRTPASFRWTIPSLEYFLGVTGLRVVNTKILKVKPLQTGDRTCFQIQTSCND